MTSRRNGSLSVRAPPPATVAKSLEQFARAGRRDTEFSRSNGRTVACAQVPRRFNTEDSRGPETNCVRRVNLAVRGPWRPIIINERRSKTLSVSSRRRPSATVFCFLVFDFGPLSFLRADHGRRSQH